MKLSLKKVIDELKSIKKFATPEEISRLNDIELNGNYANRCIYGQMTGHCDSKRALELLDKCATPLTCDFEKIDNRLIDLDFTINKEKSKSIDSSRRYNFSYLEYFIAESPWSATCAEIICDYLQGAKEFITIKDLK